MDGYVSIQTLNDCSNVCNLFYLWFIVHNCWYIYHQHNYYVYYLIFYNLMTFVRGYDAHYSIFCCFFFVLFCFSGGVWCSLRARINNYVHSFFCFVLLLSCNIVAVLMFCLSYLVYYTLLLCFVCFVHMFCCVDNK